MHTSDVEEKPFQLHPTASLTVEYPGGRERNCQSCSEIKYNEYDATDDAAVQRKKGELNQGIPFLLTHEVG